MERERKKRLVGGPFIHLRWDIPNPMVRPLVEEEITYLTTSSTKDFEDIQISLRTLERDDLGEDPMIHNFLPINDQGEQRKNLGTRNNEST